jgi:hypothetical protein
VLGIAALGGGALFAATLEPAERAALAAQFEPRAALVLLVWLLLSGACGALTRLVYLRWVAPAARLAERANVLLAAPACSARSRARAAPKRVHLPR